MESEPGPTSVQEFHSISMASEIKLELVNGHIMGFADGNRLHGVLCKRIVDALKKDERPSCQVFDSSMALQHTDAATYVYPDATYTCETLPADAQEIFEPILIVEVATPQSVVRDRINKLDTYQTIPSVQEYLIVDSRRVWASVFRRLEQMWAETVYLVDDTIELFSIATKIRMADLYAEHGLAGAQ